MELNPNQKIEISHDVLAREVYARIDASQKMRLKIVQFLNDQYQRYTEADSATDKRTLLLGRKDLSYVDPYLDKIALSKEQDKFIRDSRRQVEARERKKLIRMLVIGGVLLAATIVSLGFMIRAYELKAIADSERGRAEDAVQEAEDARYSINVSAQALKNSKNDKTQAFVGLVTSLKEDVKGNENVLATQIKRDLLANFSLFPFYRHDSDREPVREVRKIVVDDSLKYVFGLVEDSPRVLFFNTGLPEAGLKRSLRENGLLFSSLTARSLDSLGGAVKDIVGVDRGRQLVTFHERGKIWLWSLDKEEPALLDILPGHFRAMTPFKDGLLVAMDSIVYQVSLNTSAKYPHRFKIGFDRPVKFLAAQPGSPYYAVVKENSNQIIMCHVDSIGRVPVLKWDATGKAKPYVFETDPEPVTCLAFSPDGNTLIAGFEGDIAKSWRLNRPDILTEFRGHGGLISCVSFSPDGKTILTGSWDQTAILWKTDGEIIKRLVGHNNRITSIAYTYGGDAVTCSFDDDIKFWTLSPLSDYHLSFNNRIQAMAVSPVDNAVAFSVLGDDGTFRLWNWTTGKIRIIEQPRKYSADRLGLITSLAFTKDGKSIVAASRNTRLVTVIDVASGKLLEDYRSGDKDPLPSLDGIVCVDINDQYLLIGNRRTYGRETLPSGREIVRSNHFVVLLNREKPLSTPIILRQPAAVNDARFSPDNRFVLTACDDGNIYRWSIAEKKIVEILSEHASRVTSFTFSPDDKYLLSGGADNAAILWEKRYNGNYTNEGRGYTRVLEGVSNDFTGHTADVLDVDFFHDLKQGYRFITSSADKTAKLWELDENGRHREIPSIIRHLDEIRHARFSYDGQFIVTASDNGMVRVWNNVSAEATIQKKLLGGILQQ